MALKPNYNQQRRERARTKDQKKQEKQQRREEATALRKGARDDALGDGAQSDAPEGDVPQNVDLQNPTGATDDSEK